MPWPPADVEMVAHSADDGEHTAVLLNGGWLQTWTPRALEPGRMAAVILPLDDLVEQRTRSALRLWRGLQGRPPGLNPTILPLQRSDRLLLMMRALDAHLDQASYRQIAEALFGFDAVFAQPWKTSDVRQRVIRLVQAGTKLMRGGYRDLLTYPHRRKR